ncbi:hypothetical protein LCGC14_1684290 [marine sediment metagenome]|uniref:Uncharacterized protein n=1 Tax=marine sediment metagenome TaxID=412755 RepID=A0A0F9HMW1_9ZZZZ
MPTAILDTNDIIKALDFLTGNKFNINTIVNKKINKDGDLEIFWTYKKNE